MLWGIIGLLVLILIGVWRMGSKIQVATDKTSPNYLSWLAHLRREEMEAKDEYNEALEIQRKSREIKRNKERDEKFRAYLNAFHLENAAREVFVQDSKNQRALSNYVDANGVRRNLHGEWFSLTEWPFE